MSIAVRFRHRFGAVALDIEFQVRAPGITVLFGPSGAGKTTTINAIAGLLKPREGRIAIEDRILFDSATHTFVPPRARRIGYVFQDARLFPHLDVEDNLRFGWRRAPQRADTAAFARTVELLGLGSLLSRRVAGLSAGERSRVALGRALLSAPALLLLDEPLASLDTPRRTEILPWLARVQRESRLPMLYVTHSSEELAQLADEVIVIKSGRVVMQGGVFDLLADLSFSELTGMPSYGSVVQATVARQLPDQGLTALAFDGGELLVPLFDASSGTVIRIRIRAEDVILARDPPGAVSANNVLPAEVTDIHVKSGQDADIQLRSGNMRFVARITTASLTRLAISRNIHLFAVIKSVTIDPRVSAHSP